MPFAPIAGSGEWFVQLPPDVAPLPGTRESHHVCESPIVTIALPWQEYWIGSFSVVPVIAGKPSYHAGLALSPLVYDASSATFL